MPKASFIESAIYTYMYTLVRITVLEGRKSRMEATSSPGLFPRAFPLKKWEKPWGRGWDGSYEVLFVESRS